MNKELLQGPHLTNTLLGVLIRFRQGPVALMADIDAMFHQVRVDSEDKDFLRFLWWPNGDTTPEGSSIEELTSFLGLTQLITEPTNFEPNKNPSCIDLIFTDQPNLVTSSGTRSSLDSLCHHQITHCVINYNILPPSPFERRIWDYEKADSNLIIKSINDFPWVENFSKKFASKIIY